MTVAEAYQWALSQLSSTYDDREAQNVVAILFEDVWDIRSRHSVEPFASRGELEGLVDQLKAGQPIQYVTGRADFYGYQLSVSPDVLIPRPETEELVHWVISDWRSHLREIRILDIGTGSGCIPIVLEHKMHNVKVEAVDVNPAVLAIASANAEKLDAKVRFQEIDFLDEKGRGGLGEYDVIVSNPPYIAHEEADLMIDRVTSHEPHTALFPIGDDPLVFYRAIADFGLKHLREHGCIYVEINEFLPTETMAVFVDAGYKSELRDDLQGRPRMIRAWR